MMVIPHEDVKSLELLHLKLLNARLRKRKRLTIESCDFERFQKAIKAVLPIVDPISHGSKE